MLMQIFLISIPNKNINSLAIKQQGYKNKFQAHLFFGDWFSKIQAFTFLFFLIACLVFFFFFFIFLMNLLVKIYMKRLDRQTTLNNRLLQLCVLSCILFVQNSSSIFHTEQSCDQLKFGMSAAQKKKRQQQKQKQNKTKTKTKEPLKMHLGQVFQYVTSLET